MLIGASLAIITAYVQMIDQDRSPESSNPIKSASVPTMLANTHTASTSSEEDIHSKRRASPTELEDNALEMVDEVDDISAKGANLVKRPSFKKMRSSALEGISVATRRPTGGSSRQSSPKKTGSGSSK